MANNIPEEEALKSGAMAAYLEKVGPLETLLSNSRLALKRGMQEGVQEASSETLEDVIMNKFVEDELEIFPTPGVSGNPQYNNLSSDDKEKYDLAAFQFFKVAHEKKSQENPKYKNMHFTNFVKMFIPDTGFVDVLRNETSENTPADLWETIYDQNTNLYKESALKGLRRAIVASGAAGAIK
jgi:hypothetical protein